MVKKDLIFHVGMPKTGTTSLQKTFWKNRQTMFSDYGVFYPDIWLNNEGIAQHNLALLFETGEACVEDLVNDFKSILLKDNLSKLLISSESFTNSIAGKTFDLFYDFLTLLSKEVNIKIIVVLREYSSFVESMYLHSIKVGNVNSDFSRYLKDRLTWCDKYFSRLAHLRDSKEIELKIFPYDGGSVIDKFSKFLRIDFESDGSSRVNQKLTAKGQLLLYKMENYFPGFDTQRRRLVLALEQGLITFDNDYKNYTLFRENEFRLLSLISRNYAKEFSINEYFSASKDFESYIDGKRFVDLDALELSTSDLSDVEEFLKS